MTHPRGRPARPLVVVLALVIAAVGLTVLVRAYSGPAADRPPQPAAGTPTEAASPVSGNVVYLPPFLQGGPDWETRASEPLPAGDAGVAWASTTPLKDRPRPDKPAIPVETISTMPRNAVIVTAETTPWIFDSALGPFPYGEMNLDLSAAAVRAPDAEEPSGEYGVLELANDAVLVRVYFGSASPRPIQITEAQRELDTLQLPPVCPAPAKRPYGGSINPTSGPPGTIVTISGPVPFQREDGSYDRGSQAFVAWWNADPNDWPYLASFSGLTPSPATPASDLIRLGRDDAGGCTYSISFAVPDAPRGDYPIVVIAEGGGSAARQASLTFTVR